MLASGIALASGGLCAVVLLNMVSPEQASAVAAIAASGTASVRAVAPGRHRGEAVITGTTD
ncbi:hypothetical protein [Streptomyces collinus]|uniref:hypothetical protein n=1 Tax=Streptomyces collinus TaxID=42684 RepID=UPI0036342670